MKAPATLLSRPAKIKFRDESDIQEGFILLRNGGTGTDFYRSEAPKMAFQYKEGEQAEKIFEFWNVEMITFL